VSAALDGGRLGRAYFDDLYARDADPWGFATSGYERDKYAHTLEVLGDRRFTSALEVGCSIGVFTTQLASRCDSLLALDISEDAVRATRERTEGLDAVTVQRRSLPEDTPSGPFDLVVCSEVLYYWDAELLRTGLDALTAAMEPEALFLAVHWTERTREYPLQGHEAHALVAAHPALVPVRGEDRPHYRLDLLERA
jgi:predicted TPR repeat methyltransferase